MVRLGGGGVCWRAPSRGDKKLRKTPREVVVGKPGLENCQLRKDAEDIISANPLRAVSGMVTVGQNVLVISAAVFGSLLFLAALDRVWPWAKRRAHNDLIGWQLSILGTTYAVILGFMLYTVWTTYSQADLNVDIEADTLMRIYSLAEGLPEPQRTQLETLARSYVDAAIQREWPQMARSGVPTESATINAAMGKTVMSVQPGSPTEITVQDHLISELDSLTQHRLIRLMQSTTRLPTVLWCVLLVGGALTIASACMFGFENWKLHALQIFALSFLVSLSLVAIADIHRPFQGLIRVGDRAFQSAEQGMQP